MSGDGGANAAIGTILKHDAKVTSYKIALLRALNDVALSFPDLRASGRDVAVPLAALARLWVAYYWPLVDPERPILQGPRPKRGDGRANDMAFRPHLAALRAVWEDTSGGAGRPADGFYLIDELRIPRKRAHYPPSLLDAYAAAIRAIAKTIEMPIRHAGPGEWTVFARPRRLGDLPPEMAAIPGTGRDDLCVVVRADLWRSFRDLSLWIEALCIHEWCLFTETVAQPDGGADRGRVYRLLTDRPANRRPLTWERNQIDLLIMEGATFTCPWSERRIAKPGGYALDHIVPIAVYPTNELWNLVPSDAAFNSHIKRDRLPTRERLLRARSTLAATYAAYLLAAPLKRAMTDDLCLRFAAMPLGANLGASIADLVVDFVEQVGELRNVARF